MRVCPICGAANGACVPPGGAAPLEKPVVGAPAAAPAPQTDVPIEVVAADEADDDETPEAFA